MSYSDRLKVNVNRNERLKCNVLEINLDFDKGVTVKMETEIVAKLLTRMGINKDADVEGIQTCPSNLKKIYFW